MLKIKTWAAGFLFMFVAGISVAAVLPAEQDWVAKSDAHTQFLLDNIGRFAPEPFGQLGGKGLDEMITQISDEFDKKTLRALQDVLAEMETRHKRETHAAVRQDLEILIDFLKQNRESYILSNRLLLPYQDPIELIFLGLRALLDDQVAEARRPAALVRLRRYTGLETGWTPILKQAEELLRNSFKKPQLLGPFRGEVEMDLQTAPRYIAGITRLFEKYKVSGGG